MERGQHDGLVNHPILHGYGEGYKEALLNRDTGLQGTVTNNE